MCVPTRKSVNGTGRTTKSCSDSQKGEMEWWQEGCFWREWDEVSTSRRRVTSGTKCGVTLYGVLRA